MDAIKEKEDLDKEKGTAIIERDAAIVKSE